MVEQSSSRSEQLPRASAELRANPHVIVIGGGITGLSCAFQLQQRIQSTGESRRVTVLEASDRVGGKILTDRVDSFIIDAAADVFMAGKPGAVDLCAELNIKDRILETDPSNRKTYVRQQDGSLEPISMYENEPLATFRDGMQILVEATVQRLSTDTIRYATQVVGVERTADKYHVHLSDGAPLLADALILAVPAWQTATLLKSLIPHLDIDAIFAGVSYTKTTTVSVAYRATDVSHPLQGYGYIVKDAPQGSVSACTWSSSKIPGRAPEGHVLLRAFVRGVDLPTDKIHSLVLHEFHQTLGISAEPLFIRSYRWPEAIPIYSREHGERIANLGRAMTSLPGLTIAGSAIGATGIPDSIRSGMEAANAIWDYVTTGVWNTSHMQYNALKVTQSQSFFAR